MEHVHIVGIGNYPILAHAYKCVFLRILVNSLILLFIEVIIKEHRGMRPLWESSTFNSWCLFPLLSVGLGIHSNFLVRLFHCIKGIPHKEIPR